MGNIRFKVGDRVRIKHRKHIENLREVTQDMLEHCEMIMTISDIHRASASYIFDEDCHKRLWSDEMIEGLVEDKTKPEFKIGNKITNGKTQLTILNILFDKYVVEDNFGECGTLYFNTQDGWKPVEDGKEETIVDYVKESNDRYRIVVDDRFEIEVDEGEYYAVRRKKEYPKTYEECCEILGCIAGYVWGGYKGDLIKTFHMLYICRDAYWKIAGEEMGLGKPWEPDYTNTGEKKFSIWVDSGKIKLGGAFTTTQMVLSFPTEEMRDVFYEAFKEEIEMCKEFL